MAPLVSIILPTFNRAHFLEQAFDSLSAQTIDNFEVIIVDDGSSDNTRDKVRELSSSLRYPVRYFYQENQGPGIARQHGIDNAHGEILAFFDSDDEWLPSHLAQALNVLNEHPDCDWVYFACRRVDKETQKTLLPSTFYTETQPNKLFSIAREKAPGLYKLDNEKAAMLQLQDGLDSGLQNSVVRKNVFNQIAIPPFRIGEDRLLILMVVKNGFGMYFKDEVTVLYNVHDGNTSDTAIGDVRFDRRIQSMTRLISSYEATTDYVKLSRIETSALNKRLAGDYFWLLGYSLYWQSGDKKNARRCYKTALKFIGYRNFKMLKTFLLSYIK